MFNWGLAVSLFLHDLSNVKVLSRHRNTKILSYCHHNGLPLDNSCLAIQEAAMDLEITHQ